VSERLAGVEGQVASLEERRAAAEAHLHRTQVKKKRSIREAFCVAVVSELGVPLVGCVAGSCLRLFSASRLQLLRVA
jgi:hypothetical protein